MPKNTKFRGITNK